MFEMKFKSMKVATKLVTAVTILGLATGCVHEQVKNDDPATDLPALVLNEEGAEDGSGTLSASPEASSEVSSDGDLALDESSQPTLGAADSLSDSSSASSELSYTPPAELPPLAAEPSSSTASSTKKIAKKTSKKSKKVASKKKKKSSKIAKNSKKKAKKIAANKKKKKQQTEATAAASLAAQLPPAPPAPPTDGLSLDGAPDAALDSVSGSTSDVGMNLPADPSSLTSNEVTTIEPPLVLSQTTDATSSEGSFLWICFAGIMVLLGAAVFFKMKQRRREISNY